jgi:hypothetical protein
MLGPPTPQPDLDEERMMGALYLEFGLYLKMTFKAQALDFSNISQPF